jgi:hypothetical protein
MTKGNIDTGLLPDPPLLEQLGALCSLMAHDVANQLCVISGSASYAQLVIHDPQRLGAALDVITRASETVGRVVSSFGEYRRSLPTALMPGRVTEVVGALTAYAKTIGWKIELPSEITEEAVLLPPHWAVFAVRGIKRELCVKHVTLRCSACMAPVVDWGIPKADLSVSQDSRRKTGLLIRLTYSSQEPFSFKNVKARYENFGILAAFELNRMLGGEFDSRSPKAGLQEIDIWLPFHQ